MQKAPSFPKSTQVKNTEGKKEATNQTQNVTQPDQPLNSYFATSGLSLLNDVKYHGRVVSFNDECKLRTIPLPLQREVYKRAVLSCFEFENSLI